MADSMSERFGGFVRLNRIIMAAAVILVLIVGLYGTADVYADDTSGKCGDFLDWSYAGGTLTISGMGDMDNFSEEFDTAPWYSYHDEISVLVLEEGVTTIGNAAFNECSKLTSVVIPYGVRSIGNWAFCNCDSLKSVEFPSTLESIGGSAFSNCPDLTGVRFPGELKKIYGGAFARTALTSVDIPKNVDYIGGNPFSECSKLETINVSEYNEEYEDGIECNAIIYKEREDLKRLISGCMNTKIPSDVYKIDNDAFNGCTGLTEVTLSSRLESVGDRAFYNCSGLKELHIPGSLTDMGEAAFAGCGGLDSITVSPNNDYYTDMDGSNAIIIKKYYDEEEEEYIKSILILGCRNTVIPSGVTVIGSSAFKNCQGLKSADIPEGVVTIGGDAYSGCEDLTSVTIPASVTTVGYGAFRGCTALPAITIPDTVTWLSSAAFIGCTSLKEVKLSARLESIEESTFAECASLVKITIPSGVRNIDSWAFRGCAGLKSIFIPLTVTEIDYHAFEGCTSLKDIYYEGSKNQWGDVEIYDGNEAVKKATVHYNSDGSSDYQAVVRPILDTVVYDGEVHHDNIKIYDTATLQDLVEGIDYTVKYNTDCMNIGTHSFTVTYIGDYSKLPSKTCKFDIIPAQTMIISIKGAKKKVSLTCKTLQGGVKYQIAYRISGKWSYKTSAKNSATIKKLKSGKKYSFKVRAFKNVSGKAYYGDWSGVKKVKVK